MMNKSLKENSQQDHHDKSSCKTNLERKAEAFWSSHDVTDAYDCHEEGWHECYPVELPMLCEPNCCCPKHDAGKSLIGPSKVAP